MRAFLHSKAIDRAFAAIAMTRPHNCLLAAGCVMLGGYLTSGQMTAHRLWIAAFAAGLLVAAATVINDCIDVESDRINKPYRVLPSGRLSSQVAWAWGVTLGIAGIAAGVSLGGMAAIVPALWAILAVAYSVSIKGMSLLADIFVSAMIASTVLFGGMVVGEIEQTIVPALVVLAFMLCREILKDVEDYEGDRAAGTRTVAVAWGPTLALRAFSVGAVAAVGASFLPWLTGVVSVKYLLIALPLVDPVLLASAYVISRSPTERTIRLTLEATKLAALLWLLAMFVGAS